MFTLLVWNSKLRVGMTLFVGKTQQSDVVQIKAGIEVVKRQCGKPRSKRAVKILFGDSTFSFVLRDMLGRHLRTISKCLEKFEADYASAAQLLWRVPTCKNQHGRVFSEGNGSVASWFVLFVVPFPRSSLHTGQHMQLKHVKTCERYGDDFF